MYRRTVMFATGVDESVFEWVPEPQPVLTELSDSAVFLVVSSIGTQSADHALLAAAADVNSLVRAAGFRQTSARLSCVVGFGAAFWDRVHAVGDPRPAGLHPLAPIHGAVHDAPSTPGDVLFHIRADRADLTFELSRMLIDALGESVSVECDVTGFRYFDARDLLGFVDGTENPTGRSASDSALIGSEDPEFAGGSYVIVQKYLHDLTAWGALTTEEQERIIGRTKLDDIELDDDAMPNNSHVTLNTIVDEDGVEHDVLRDNMPFGNPGSGEYGTFYIAYSRDVSVTEQMLRNMFVGNPPGNYDRILDVSTAVTGTLFFAPSLTMLEAMPDTASLESVAAEDDSALPVAPDSPQPVNEHTIVIGSLKGEPQ